MRGVWRVVLAIMTASLLTGMGNLGGTPEGTVPKTEENFKARVVDRSGVTTEVEHLSLDGKVFLEGGRGEGKITIRFRDLKEVGFGAVQGNEVAADLLFKSGEHQQLKVPKNALFYGDAGYGVFRIAAGDVSRIVFLK